MENNKNNKTRRDDSSLIMVVQMMAAMKNEEECVEEVIVALTKYKAKKFEGNHPFAEILILMTKWEQGEKNANEIMESAIEKNKIVNKMHDFQKEIDNTPAEPVITGPTGDA